jgi:hypothetical protein
MKTIRGQLELPDDVRKTNNVRVVVRLRDITYSDAPAPTPEAEAHSIENIDPAMPIIGFSLDVSDEVLAQVDERKRVLNVEAHVDLDGSGSFSPGDLVTLDAHPLGRNAADEMLTVKLVRS